MPRFPFEEWLPETLRLTAFPSPDVNLKPEEWWGAATGSEPEEVSIAKRGTSSVIGPYGGGKLILRCGLDRIDWLFAPTDSVIERFVLLGKSNSIGPIDEVMIAFTAAVERWLRLSDSPEINRMGFGPILGRPVNDQKQAYRDLMEYIPVDVPLSSSDLLFQINPPPIKSSYVPGLEFNRLSKWAVVQVMVIAAPSSIEVGVPLMQATTPGPSIRLELDINTVPTFAGPIPRETRFAVFQELVDHAKSIALNGAIPDASFV